MNCLIVSGGSLDYDFALNYLRSHEFDLIIAADKGMEFFLGLYEHPNLILGDFDSVNPSILNEMRAWPDVSFRQYPSEKDETDTELAIHTAMELGANRIILLGATGTRYDHSLANIQLLKQCLMTGIEAQILDQHNRIYLRSGAFTIRRDQALGDFFTLLALEGDVTGLSIEGAKYCLQDAILSVGSSLGVSNELKEEEVLIKADSGIVLVIESRD